MSRCSFCFSVGEGCFCLICDSVTPSAFAESVCSLNYQLLLSAFPVLLDVGPSRHKKSHQLSNSSSLTPKRSFDSPKPSPRDHPIILQITPAEEHKQTPRSSQRLPRKRSSTDDQNSHHVYAKRSLTNQLMNGEEKKSYLEDVMPSPRFVPPPTDHTGLPKSTSVLPRYWTPPSTLDTLDKKPIKVSDLTAVFVGYVPRIDQYPLYLQISR